MRQVLVVLGSAPFICDYCPNEAVVATRFSKEGQDYTTTFCENCWISMHRAYSPLVARDEQNAVIEAAKLIAGDDDQQKAGVKA